MPEKMRTRPTNLAGRTQVPGAAAPETLGAWGAGPRRGLRSDAPRIRPRGAFGRTRTEARLPLHAHLRAFHAFPAPFDDRRSFGRPVRRVARLVLSRPGGKPPRRPASP